MPSFIVIGTDTDAGKTTFSLLWMTHFAGTYSYWKPYETGTSDSETIRRLVPTASIIKPIKYFREPVAPPLAAKREGTAIPPAVTVELPDASQPILVETFGGPFSPLNDDELQIEVIRHLRLPVLLVSSSAVGAIGRVLSCVRALAPQGVVPAAIVLIGEEDPYAMDEIEKATTLRPFALPRPTDFTSPELRSLVQEHQHTFADIEKTFTPNKVAHNLIARDRQAVWHPYTSLLDPLEPIPVVGAEDHYLYLEDGRVLIDAISSWWTILHGHRPPHLVRALHKAVEQLDHVIFGGATHPDAVTVAELLLKATPWPTGGRCFFSDNGSTAVEVALKMAYQWWVHRGEPNRTLFLGFQNGYHGDTFGAMAVSRDPIYFAHYERLLFRAIQVPLDLDAVRQAFVTHAGEIAGVIIEPLVQGAGGMIFHPSEMLAGLAQLCQEFGIKLIVDEVMTAGRTGTWWAFSQAGISPDLICTSKTLAGGMLPLAATLAAPEIVQEFMTHDRRKMLFHGHSFTANPLACAVAAENLRTMQNGKWLQDVRRIEEFWQSQQESFWEYPLVGNVRVKGTIIAVDLESPGGYLAPIGPMIKQYAIDHGVLLRPLGNVLYAMPPLCTSATSLHKIADVMRGAIEFVSPT